MSERVFYSIEELRAFLQTVPKDVRVNITIEVEGDGGKESGEEIE